MALLTKFGTFQVPISHPTTQVVSGIGFQPKIVLLFSNYASGNTNQNQFERSLGVIVAPNTTMLSFYEGDSYGDGVGQLLGGQNGNIVRGGFVMNTSTEQYLATLSSVDADAFTLSWAQPSSTGVNYPPKDIFYLALGGDDLINASLHEVDRFSYSGPHRVGGLGYIPNCALTFAMKYASGSTGERSQSMGVKTPTDEYVMSVSARGGSTSGAHSMLRSGYSIGNVSSQFNRMENLSNLTFDSSGILVNKAAGGSASAFILAMELSEPLRAGTMLTPSGASQHVVTGMGAAPQAMWFLSRNNAPSATHTTNAFWSEGVTDGTDGAAATAIRYSSAASHGFQRTSNDIAIVSGYSHLPTEQNMGTVALDGDGFTTSWSTSTVSGREVLYIAFPEQGVVPPIDDAYDMIATSDVTINATATLNASVAIASDLDIAAAASVVRHADYDFAALSAIDLTAARTLNADVLASLQSDFAVTAARSRDAGYDLFADADLAYAHVTLKDASFTIVGDLDFYYSTFATQLGEFTLAADSEFAYAGNVDAVAAFTIDAESGVIYTAQRLVDAEWSATAVSTTHVSALRIREGVINSEALSDLDYAAIGILGGRFDIAADSSVFISSGSRLSGDMIATIDSDMTYRAKPKLIRTYEDAYGRVQGVLVRGQHVPVIRTLVKPLIKGIKS